MTNLMDVLLDRVVKTKIRNSIVDNRVSPNSSAIHTTAIDELKNILDLTSVPKIDYKAPLIATEYENNILRITDLISSLSQNAKDLESSYSNNNKSYRMVEDKIDNAIKDFQKRIDILSNFSCYSILSDFSKQTLNSYSGNIGKFVTLPFFIGNVSLYAGACYITVATTGEIGFSNLSFISSLPMERSPALKIKSTLPTIELVITMALTETPSNMIYAKFDNDVTSFNMKLSSNGKLVVNQTFKENEILMNYEPIIFDTITMSVILQNQNIDKPVSVRMSDFKIFSNIKFAKTGVFESVPEKLNNPTGFSSVSLGYLNIGNISNTQTNPMISISADPIMTSYNLIDVDQPVNITLDKFKYTKEFTYQELTDKTLLDVDYRVYTILPEDNEWDLGFKSSVIMYGMNKDLLTDLRAAHGFENWTLEGNYYKSTLLNYEDNVTVNTGSSTIIINGKEQSGIVAIPVGISNVSIHTKDVDFASVDMLDKTTTMNPFNFAYLFTGLPEYNDGGTLIPADKVLKTFNIESSTSVSLNESFMPFSEEVTDEYANLYKLSLTEIPYIQGTYSILPNIGSIYINPAPGAKNIDVLYYKASPTKRPSGILFNRLLTFANLPSLLSLKTIDNTLFSFGGTETERYLILPKIPNVITNSQLMYNLSGDNLYFSTRIQMLTNNNYLTPILNTMSLSVK